ncbi:hypothetical protein [Microbacterium hominis]|uniref:DUF3558 domain-containing protein n=1 Tax=Microbacterium hominis TaxID=162426 RepID=A0A7D4TFB4_9MICO|nr:hypothetical protein [Microbacterium hominis]QKJ18461.1 hypothetical protein HQM25_02990 [Microbacterium hominis]
MRYRPARATRRAASLLLPLVVALGALSACAPDAETAPPSASATPESTPEPIATRSADPSATPVAARIPTDCRAILTDDVLAQLEEVPLNDPAFGESGALADGSLVCVWADPAADTTGLTTTISRMSRGPALDLMNDLADEEDFTCYTPDDGTRCEKTWENETYPVTDGRTLFWRDDILIDTQYSNLAPTGYTSAVIASIFG